jgi:acyl-CoA reductase-like NAD-dependent aldehyde dehydrogenase
MHPSVDQPAGLLIGNEWRPASAGRTLDVVNPATEEVIAGLRRPADGL